jgi:hypothetical protein
MLRLKEHINIIRRDGIEEGNACKYRKQQNKFMSKERGNRHMR